MARCELRIELDEPSARFRAGSEIRGRVVVDVDAEVQCDGLTVAVGWFTHGQGNRATGDTTSIVLFRGAWSIGDGHAYPFSLPAPSTPLPYAGEVLNVDFRVHAAADIPWAIDPAVEVPIEVVHEPPPSGLVIEPIEKEPAWGVGCMGCSVVLLIGGGLGGLAASRVSEDAMVVPAIALFFGLAGFAISIARYLAERKLGEVRVRLTQATAGSYRDAQRADQLVCDVELGRAVPSCRATAALEVREEVVRGSGSNKKTHTHRHYASEVVLEAIDAKHFRSSLALPAPGSVPYSFSAASNDLKWEVTVVVDAPGSPNWTEKFVLQARPAGAAR